jgi:hypothetical protein
VRKSGGVLPIDDDGDPGVVLRIKAQPVRSPATLAQPHRHVGGIGGFRHGEAGVEYPNSKEVRVMDGGDALRAGSVFRWTTFGLPLESRINEFTPFSRIGWYGYAPGEQPSFYHTWYLNGAAESCLVVTDEVGRGTSAAHLRETDESLMHRGHDLWLATLKWVAESK